MDFSQFVGENRIYEQDVISDVIVGAAWDIKPAGPVLVPIAFQPTLAQCQVSFSDHGSFILTVSLNCASGQLLKGQARINVSKVSV